MPRVQRTAAAAAAAVISTAGASSAQVSVTTSVDTAAGAEECRTVRILPNGRRVFGASSDDGVTSASVRRSGRGGSSVSASASSSVSSSSAGGRSTSTASTHANGRGRTVTTTRDENGCTVVIDERNSKGTKP